MLDGLFVSIRNSKRKTLIPLTIIKNERLFNKAGFSLLEFTIALTIIVILVSILIPKLTNLQDDAHKANVQLIANSLQSVVNFTHSLWQSQGSKNKTALLKGFGDGNILMGNKGWPVDAIDLEQQHSDPNATRLVLNSSTCKRLWNGLLIDAAPKVKVSTVEQENKEVKQPFIYQAEFDQGLCIYRYLLVNNGARIEYDLATGRVITLF